MKRYFAMVRLTGSPDWEVIPHPRQKDPALPSLRLAAWRCYRHRRSLQLTPLGSSEYAVREETLRNGVAGTREVALPFDETTLPVLGDMVSMIARRRFF